jgi:hypothetical protein
MNYTVKFSAVETPELFTVFVNLINHLKDQHKTMDPDELNYHLKQDHNIDIKYSEYKMDTITVYEATFADEQHYTFFLLRWS